MVESGLKIPASLIVLATLKFLPPGDVESNGGLDIIAPRFDGTQSVPIYLAITNDSIQQVVFSGGLRRRCISRKLSRCGWRDAGLARPGLVNALNVNALNQRLRNGVGV